MTRPWSVRNEDAPTVPVTAAYGATHLLADSSDLAGAPAGTRNGTLTLPGVPIPVISAGEWAYDPRS